MFQGESFALKQKMVNNLMHVYQLLPWRPRLAHWPTHNSSICVSFMYSSDFVLHCCADQQSYLCVVSFAEPPGSLWKCLTTYNDFILIHLRIREWYFLIRDIWSIAWTRRYDITKQPEMRIALFCLSSLRKCCEEGAHWLIIGLPRTATGQNTVTKLTGGEPHPLAN